MVLRYRVHLPVQLVSWVKNPGMDPVGMILLLLKLDLETIDDEAEQSNIDFVKINDKR